MANNIDRSFESGEGLSYVRTAIVLFSLQLALTVVGIDAFKLRLAQRGISCQQTLDSFQSDESVLTLISDLDFENSLDLTSAVTFYNGGALFGGKFENICDLKNGSDVQPFAKRALHLPLQLSLTRPALLVPLIDLYGTARGIQQCQFMQDDEAGSTALFTPEWRAHVKTLPAGCGEVLCDLLQKDVLNITPAVTTSSLKFDSVFETLLQADVQALPLLISVLNSVLVDLEIPASDHMVHVVRSFYDSLPEGNKDIRLLIPVLGGMTREDVEALLPKLILELHDDGSSSSDGGSGAGEDGDNRKSNAYMRKCIARITRARPPPLSKAHLLVALHRYIPHIPQYKSTCSALLY